MKISQLFEFEAPKQSPLSVAVTPQILDAIERKLDALYKNINVDVDFSKHFAERLSDARNIKPVTVSELVKIFTDAYKKYAHVIKKSPYEYQAVLTDLSSMLNVPFVLNWDNKHKEGELKAKTIMRKPDFQTSNPKLVVETKLIPDIVYHGSNQDFKEFLKTKSPRGDYGLRGAGFYFSPNKLTAANYGKIIYAAQLSIKNPFDPLKFKSAEELAAHLNVDASIFKLDPGNEFKVYSSFSGAFAAAVKEAGYDGIIYTKGQEIIAFYPAQIKILKQENKINEAQQSAVYVREIPDVYKKLPVLGKGLTSIVMDKGDGNVLMFTRDAIKKDWLTKDWGIKIGNEIDVLNGFAHKKMAIRNMPIYVIELPKLFKLDSNNKRILKTEMMKWEKCWAEARHKNALRNHDNIIIDAINNFIEQYPASPLIPIMEFMQNYSGYVNMDLAPRNTLQDVDGNMIFVDPLVSKELLDVMCNHR